MPYPVQLLIRRAGGAAALAAALAGCASARREVRGDVVRNVQFEGNGDWWTRPISGQSHYQLRSQLDVSPAPFRPFTFVAPFTWFVDLEPFDVADLERSSYKLEVWYAHHGWFDAQVEGWEVRQVRPRTSRKAGVVEVTGFVDPGPRSMVRAFEVRGLDKVAAIHGRVVSKHGDVHPGDPFVLDYVFSTRDRLAEGLRSGAYAYADVVVDVDAFPEDGQVDVALDVTLGPVCRFGDVGVQGLGRVDEAVVRDLLGFAAGDPYDLSSLRQAQRRLFETGWFSVVTVTPDLSDPAQKRVPVVVSVTEALPRTLRVGGGVDTDGQTTAPRFTGEFENLNFSILGSELWRLGLRGEYGYAGTGGGERDVVASAEANLSQPRLFGSKRFGLLGDVGVHRDLQGGQFPYRSMNAGASLSWQADDFTVLTLGPHWTQYRYLDFDGPTAIAAGTLFGQGFENPYSLATIDAGLVIDWRDDPAMPRDGSYGSLQLRQAVPFDEQDFFYTEINGDARSYFRVHNPRGGGRAFVPEVLALRGRGEWLIAWDGRALPYPEKAFLGGPTDLRGFRSDQVGPYACVCQYQPVQGGGGLADDVSNVVRRAIGMQEIEAPEPGDPFTGVPGAGQEVEPVYLARGGAFAALLSAELRYELPYDLQGVAFADAGLLGDRLSDVRIDNLRLGYGAGLRYQSPIGPLRVDVAFRPIYPEDWGPSRDRYINCQVDDRLPRAFDLPSSGRGARDLAGRDLPFAVNVFFGLGQSI